MINVTHFTLLLQASLTNFILLIIFIYPGNFWYFADPRPNSDSETEKPKPAPASAGEVCYFLTQKMNAIRNSDAMECRDTLSYELVSGVFLKRYFHHGNYI